MYMILDDNSIVFHKTDDETIDMRRTTNVFTIYFRHIRCVSGVLDHSLPYNICLSFVYH